MLSVQGMPQFYKYLLCRITGQRCEIGGLVGVVKYFVGQLLVLGIIRVFNDFFIGMSGRQYHYRNGDIEKMQAAPLSGNCFVSHYFENYLYGKNILQMFFIIANTHSERRSPVKRGTIIKISTFSS